MPIRVLALSDWRVGCSRQPAIMAQSDQDGPSSGAGLGPGTGFEVLGGLANAMAAESLIRFTERKATLALLTTSPSVRHNLRMQPIIDLMLRCYSKPCTTSARAAQGRLLSPT